jgi:hypothetical protein
MAKLDKYEVNVGDTRWVGTRADGSDLTIEAGQAYEAQDAEEEKILADAAEAGSISVKGAKAKGGSDA